MSARARALTTAGLACMAALAATPGAWAAAPTRAIEVRSYSLGDVTIPDRSPFGPLPVRLEGAIAAPVGNGRYPLVVVAHGRHPVGCPARDAESERWPCPGSDRRHDLGFRPVLRALAKHGMVAISPNVNGAHTEGWGEPDGERRWPRIVDRTLSAVATEVRQGGDRFGIGLQGRVRLGRIGFLGHSQSGLQSARLALRRQRRPGPVARGRGPLSSLFLLAPVDGARLAEVPTAVVVGTCDFDTGRLGTRYLNGARRRGKRRTPVFELTLRGANHNFFNRTLSRLRSDDAAGTRGRCRKRRRLRAGVQQRWLARAAADFFSVTLRGGRRPAWLRRSARPPARVYGRSVRVRRLVR